MTTDPRYGPAGDGYGHRTWEDLAVAEDHAGWVSRSRVVLTPIAAPSIMGRWARHPRRSRSGSSGSHS